MMRSSLWIFLTIVQGFYFHILFSPYIGPIIQFKGDDKSLYVKQCWYTLQASFISTYSYNIALLVETKSDLFENLYILLILWTDFSEKIY